MVSEDELISMDGFTNAIHDERPPNGEYSFSTLQDQIPSCEHIIGLIGVAVLMGI
jgi:hypothetical protein